MMEVQEERLKYCLSDIAPSTGQQAGAMEIGTRKRSSNPVAAVEQQNCQSWAHRRLILVLRKEGEEEEQEENYNLAMLPMMK